MRIAGLKNPTYSTHRIIIAIELLVFLTVVSAQKIISSDLRQWDRTLQHQTTRNTKEEEKGKIINPIVSYTEAVDFKEPCTSLCR
jgi:hypothetical protein